MPCNWLSPKLFFDMKIYPILFISLIVGLLIACDQSVRKKNPTAPVEELNEEVTGGVGWTKEGDAEFLQDAFRYSRRIIRFGLLARDKATYPELRGFAEKSVKYHRKMNADIEEMAKKLEVPLPGVVGQEVSRRIQEMEEMEGEEFDKTYVSVLDDIQVEKIIRFEEAEAHAHNTSIREWASERLPEIKSHELSLDELKDEVLDFPPDTK